MAVTLYDIRFLVEHNVQERLDDPWIINQSNAAQIELLQRVFIPGTYNLPVNQTDLSYTLPPEIYEIRSIRSLENYNNGFNVPIYPVYTYYNGLFQVPVSYFKDDTFIIDYYKRMKTFNTIDDAIDIEDHFKTLYSAYIEAMYYNLATTRANIGEVSALNNYNLNMNYYQTMKKQVTDFYINAVGTEKPAESGW